VILLLSFDVRRRGGIERLTLQVQHSLESQGQQVVLLCPQRLGPGLAGRWLGRSWFLLRLAWWLPRATQVLSMHALLLRPVLALRWLRPARQSLWAWIHGIEVWGAALQPVASQLRRCEGLMASSTFTRDQLLARPGLWPAVRVVHPMANLIDGREPPTPLPQGLRLLTVARLAANERYKGHRLVLAALAQLRANQALPPDLRWRVVGNGDDLPALQQECRAMGLEPWVQFLGSLSDTALRDELNGCSLLLMPSAYGVAANGQASGEGFGIVYLEAAQARRASIACRAGGQTDLIVDRRTGWLIDPDPSQLAALLRQLLQPEGHEQLSQAGQGAWERAGAQFDAGTFNRALAAALGLPPPGPAGADAADQPAAAG
jgi:phosphatidylinositol alpha-1,6-mannosyltransferase